MVTSELKDPRKVIDPVLLLTFLLDDLHATPSTAFHPQSVLSVFLGPHWNGQAS